MHSHEKIIHTGIGTCDFCGLEFPHQHEENSKPKEFTPIFVSEVDTSEGMEMPEYNHSQLYILINALENLKLSIHEPEYEFIRNNLLERFRKQLV